MNKYELKEIAEKSKPDITEYMNCGYINSIISDELEDKGLTVNNVIGGIWKTKSKREEHTFIEIPANEIQNARNTVKVDGAIKQFCESNRDDLWVVLGPKEEIPEVAVLDGTEKHNWYEMLTAQVPPR